MKDEKVWDYTWCPIGGPCLKCVPECNFRKSSSLVVDQDEKEKKNERISESDEKRY